MLEESQLTRGQVNMADEAKLFSPIHSTFEALFVWCVIGCCRGEVDPFYWPVLAAGAGVFSVSHWFMSILLRGHGFTGIQKAVVDQAGSTPPNSDHNLCWCKFGFGKCFRASSRSSHWAGRCQLYKIHFSSCITIWLRNGSLWLLRIREDASKWFFFIFDQLTRHPLKEFFSPFQFASNAKWL